VGTVLGKLALFESDAGLVALDCRAAQARILYEHLLADDDAAPRTSQRMLIPEGLRLPAVEAAILVDQRDVLAAEGLVVEPFGRDFFRIEAVPDWLEPHDAAAFVRDAVALVREGVSGSPGARLNRAALARLAAGKSMRVRVPTTADAALDLAARLFRCRLPLTAPDGRATLTEFTASELERRLGQH
jgi:DNA mismatch repair protein MutL